MSKIDWSKTPDAQFFVNGSFYKYDQGKWFWSSSDGIWAKTPYESPENFSWWGFRVEAPVAWNGEGLPPVGMHVVVHDDGSLVYGHGESGEVLAHVDGCAVIRMSYGLGCFLPRVLRTPEQTQQEERENTIAEMACIVRSVVGCGVNMADMAALYDAGFRKQEPKPE